MVQATCAGEESKTRWKVGWATLTTVMSRIAMIAPRTMTPATSRTRLSSLSGSPAGAGWLEVWSEMLVVTGTPYGVTEPQVQRNNSLADSGHGDPPHPGRTLRRPA